MSSSSSAGAPPRVRPQQPRLPGKPQPIKSHMTQEEFDALGYPKVPEEWNEEWMRKQIELEKVDPRVNPNLLLDETHQEFWDNMSRKPYAKAILKSEQHWTARRRAWCRQYERVELANALRQELADELETCPVDLKRLVAPIMKYKITEIALGTSLRQARACRQPFAELLQQPEQLQRLHSLRSRLDEGGAKAADRLLDEFTARAEDRMLETNKLQREKEKSVPITVDSDTMAKLMNQAQKLRKDGYIEWEKGAVEEAFTSWGEAEAQLYRKRLPESDVAGNRNVEELHLVLLKNIAQAAIKLGQWSNALTAADDALAIDDQDSKAWFRRACALEGLGRFEEQEAALACVEDLAVGRPDRPRILRDVDTRRRRVAALTASSTETERRSLARAVARGVFAAERDPALQDEAEDDEELELLRLEEELLALEMEEAELLKLDDDTGGTEQTEDGEKGQRQVPQAAETIHEPPPFKVGDRVVAREDMADIVCGQAGTVLEIDGDGDVKVLFDGQDEARLVFSIDFGSLAQEGASDSSSSSASAAAERKDPALPKRKCATMCLTQDGASDLLDALASAYQDSGFQRQQLKLARDVRWNVDLFMSHMPKVALEQQKEVLQRWGFEASVAGAEEAQLALEDAVNAAPSDRQRHALKAQSDEVTRLLYGEMYEVVFRQKAR